jgi:hypothetical protein
MAVYSVLEKTVSDPDLGQGEKEKMLLEEVKQFQLLKSKITESRSPYLATGQQKPAAAEQIPDIQKVAKAIEDLKSMMVTELTAIREEIEQLRKQ